MPTDERILGFSNWWYPTAIETAQGLQIAGRAVRIVTPALFIATKLEAFHGRGGDDVFLSHDLEDIVAVVDGRPTIVDDVVAALEPVRTFIASEMRSLLESPDFLDALPGVLRPDAASQAPTHPGSPSAGFVPSRLTLYPELFRGPKIEAG